MWPVLLIYVAADNCLSDAVTARYAHGFLLCFGRKTHTGS